MSETFLTLSVGGLPPFSARGCKQELSPIKTAEVHRTINGELVTTESSLHHKYKTTIKGCDQLPAALDKLWKGEDVEVGCIQYLWQKTDEVEVELDRVPVEGSIRAINHERREIQVVNITGRKVRLSEPGYIGYRPLLLMKILDFGYEIEEWGDNEISWYMKLEEA